jgi:hypothetical protein
LQCSEDSLHGLRFAFSRLDVQNLNNLLVKAIALLSIPLEEVPLRHDLLHPLPSYLQPPLHIPLLLAFSGLLCLLTEALDHGQKLRDEVGYLAGVFGEVLLYDVEFLELWRGVSLMDDCLRSLLSRRLGPSSALVSKFRN